MSNGEKTFRWLPTAFRWQSIYGSGFSLFRLTVLPTFSLGDQAGVSQYAIPPVSCSQKQLKSTSLDKMSH
jgi:hypothetical protein